MVAVFAKARAELRGFTSDIKKFDQSLDGLNSRITGLNRRIGNVDDKFKNWRSTLRAFTGDGDDADDSLKRLDKILDQIGGTTIRASRGQRDYARSTKDSTRETDKHKSALDRIKGAFGGAGASAASFGNELRGIAIVFGAAFAQQLITALVGLGGQLVATASSAAMAGAAIGGILTAGIAQAIPVVGLLAGALVRVKGVMDAVQQAQKLQQADARAGFEAGRKQADGTDAIANAQDGLRSALDNVRQAQENLTTTRAEALRNLHDMILAEQEAELAAKGAALSQRDAQQALQQAIRTGGDVARAQLQVQEANLGARRARTDVRRQRADTGRAVAGGVEGLPDVRRAAAAVQDAERAVTRAQRGLETARRNATEAVAGTQTAAANLNYLLSQLSPAERKLYEAVRRVQTTWRTTWRDITDPIIGSFTSGVDRINQIMKMPSVLRTARSLSTEIADQLDDITKSFTSDRVVHQFERIARESKKNLEPVTGIVEDVGHAFLNIAEAAGPSFRRFLGYVGDLADKFLGITEDKDKVEDFFNVAETHLESWINLALAVGNLFAAISGAGGAEAGKKGIDDLTTSLNDMADSVRDNAGDVKKFFDDARESTDAVISVLKTLVEQVGRAFSPDHLQHFADILNNIVIPALANTIIITSAISDIFAQILDIPVVGEIAKWGLTFAALAYVGGSALKTIATFSGRFISVLRVLIPLLFNLGRAFLVAIGPVGWAILAITAIIGVIILLDRRFHFLGPTLKWLKGAFSDVFDWIKDHWPLLLAILTGPFGLAVLAIVKNWGAIKRAFTGAFNFIKDKLSDFADWVGDKLKSLGRNASRYLVQPFKRAGKAAADGLVDGFKTVVNFFSDIGKWLYAHVVKLILTYFQIEAGASKYFARIGKNLVNGLIDGFKGLPDVLLSTIKTMGDKLMDVGGEIGEWIRKGLEKVPGGKLIIGASGKVAGLLHLAGGGPVPGSGSGDVVSALLEPGEHVLTKGEVAAAGGHAVIFALRALLGGGGQGRGGGFQAGGRVAGAGSLSIDFHGGSLDDFTSTWRSFWQVLVRSARIGTAGVETEFRQMRVNTTRSVDRMYRDVRGSISDIQHSFLVRSRDLIDNWRGAWLQLSNLAFKGLSYIGHEANRALTGFGANAIHFGLSAPAAQGRQRGGMIPGWGDGDRVPVMAEPGEGFINKRAVRALGGPAVINAINAMIPRFATGGVVGSHIKRLIAAANKVSNLNLPYVWGGGHTQPAQIGSGMDCSGSVSYAVQQAGYKVPTTTSGNIGSWGFPRGGDGASIFFNPIHTFMKIGSRFWGTSGFARPNGGAGWFTSAPGAGYLSQFQQVHLPGINDVGAFATAAGEQLARLMVRGPRRGFKSFFQHMFDKVIGAGNDFIASKDSSADPIASGDPGEGSPAPPGQHRNWIKTALRLAGLPVSAANINAQYTLDIGESSGNPKAVQRIQDINSVTGNLARGIAQVIPPTFRAFMLPGHGNIFNAVDNIIASVRYQMSKYGHLVGHPGYAEGGVVGGDEGTPVPITAHAGEWVLNKVQQARLAGLTGLNPRSLMGMLGFYGGKGSFQGGGGVEDAVLRGPLEGVLPLKNVVAAALRRALVELRDVTSGYVKDLRSRSGVVGTFVARLDGVMDELANVSGRLNRVKQSDRRRGVTRFIAVVASMTADGGLFDQLRTAIETRARRAQRALLRARFDIGGGRTIREAQTPAEQAAGALTEQRRLQGDLLDEQGAITRELHQVRRQQRRRGLTNKQRQDLAGQAAALEGRLDDAQQRIAENIQAIFEAQVAAQQAVVDEITKRAESATAFNEFNRRLAGIFGNQGWMAQIAARQREILTNERNELMARIDIARSQGATELADQLVQQVEDLRVQIAESLAQELQDAAQQIQERAQRSQGRLDLLSRFLTATGTVGRTAARTFGGETFTATGIAERQQANTLRQIGETQDLIDRVNREQPENKKLVQDLTDSLDDLKVTLVEQGRAEFQARIDALSASTDYTLTLNDLNKQILDLGGQISGNTDAVGLLKLANDRQAILADKGNELQRLYNEAVSRDDVQAQQDLTKAMLENQVAMLQNTQAINELTGASKDPQTFSSSAWTQFREAIFTGMGQILPQYQFPMAATGGIAMRAGLYHLEPGELYRPPDWGSKQEGDINLTIHEAGRPIDTTEVSAAIAFARKAYQ